MTSTKKGYKEGRAWVGTVLKTKGKTTTNKILRLKNLALKFLLSLKKSAEPGFEPRTYRMQNQSANHYTMVTLLKVR